MEAEEIYSSIEPTRDKSKAIKAISKDNVHKICSGQVILSLAIAVKELLENSIDAGSTRVEVKLKDYGLELIEVVDNGCGVEECNFEGMTAKYHTSKLREFSDLEAVATFGFRGEALSSLCALSDMVIITKHISAEFGTKLELDHNGKIIKKSPCPRQTGTSVILTNLFSSLPVRKKEFTKNIKKEFTKMCQILQAYCLASVGVRIICTNQTTNGAKSTLFCTSGNGLVLDNIIAIFGSKQSNEILPMKPPVDVSEKYTLEDLNDTQNPESSLEVNYDDIERLNMAQFEIEGFISNCNHGSGRSSKDRQYFYVNSRPCEPKNIIKLVNDVYRRFNGQQYPFVYLNLKIQRSEVDVNLTPDKRQLLVNNEKIILLAIKRSLMKTFANIPSTFKIQNSTIQTMFKIHKNNSNVESEDDEDVKLKPNSQKFSAILSQWKATGSTDQPCKTIKNIKRKPVDEINVRKLKMKKIQEFLSQEGSSGQRKVQDGKEDDQFAKYKSDSESEGEGNEKSIINNISLIRSDDILKKSEEFDCLIEKNTSTPETRKDSKREIQLTTSHVISCKNVDNKSYPKLKFEKIPLSDHAENEDELSQYTEAQESEANSDVELFIDDSPDDEACKIPNSYQSSEIIQTTIEEIRKLVLEESKLVSERKSKYNLARLKFKSEINPTQNTKAEEELQREITKDMFSQMEIIGQFNLGFIIVKLDSDLFIIDQHATDEKYNFEDLQKTTTLQNQQLVIPQSLELMAVNEMILIDNKPVFEMNGFKFLIDENAPTTKKVKLTAKPFSKNWEFGKEDIDELIFMLQDAPPNTICRPSRVRAMFASRACRKSVMIGKPLNNSVMRKIVNHMGEIEQPWSCPHGRPTMRHLINLAMLEETREEED